MNELPNAVAALVTSNVPVASLHQNNALWEAHLGTPKLPVEFVDRVRCFVLVEGLLVMCETSDGRVDAWPGGGIQENEGLEDAAAREVLEETGWHIDPRSLRPIGWLRVSSTTSDPDPRWPVHSLQLVCTVAAVARDPAQGEHWVDVEGYVTDSWLTTFEAAIELVNSPSELSLPFLRFLAAERGF